MTDLLGSYSSIEGWFCDNLIVENVEKYKTVSNPDYLIRRFKNGEKRASVSFSAKTASGNIQPFKTVFYLYEDNISSDIFTFCVIYDLTEQQRKEKELRDLENKLQISRISNFTSQMQPHFLYNALGSIQEIILENPKYAHDLISDFTIHLRSCIRAMSTDYPIPFEEELKNIKAYINIEKMRFGEKLKVKYEIETSDFLIIPLSIQPLVENAIRHGIYKRGTVGGTVVIRTKERKNGWIVEVEDDGVGFDSKAFLHEIESGHCDSTGIKNIIFRFEKVMNAKVAIKSVLNCGTRVTVTIPKGEKDESNYS
ncbi:MAG: histidine kinase [Clostridia bacterium]|nr:histidine kinase [Clostridia bacterium]